MKPLFSRAGKTALESLPIGQTLLGFDFDGTIAPIVPEPDAAFTLKSIRPQLRKLSRRAPVVIISGRALGDVEHRLHFNSRYIVGNHGLEGLREFKAKADRANRVCRKWVAQIERELKNLPEDHGIFVEDKVHSLSLHYRQARNPLKTMSWLAGMIDNLWPEPRVIGGKLIFNLVPKGSPHKGTALKVLMKRLNCTHAIFVGDDVTDEDAFAEKGRILSVRVGRKKNSCAKFFISGQNDMPQLIDALLRRFS